MTCEHEEGSKSEVESMNIDIPDANNGEIVKIRENGLLLFPVLPQQCGTGLPYAPADWPDPGDNWDWRAGKRTAVSGYYCDRYLYPPMRFQKPSRKKEGFASRLSVEQYVRARFPGADIKAFFSSFSWRIPSKQAYLIKEQQSSCGISPEEASQESLSSLTGIPVCKAGNRFCCSLLKESKSVFTMSCDVCCSEPNFCRDCSCILCCKTLDFALGGYSFIRCEATVSHDIICGHAAHINCALRSYMAGTVGGSIGLDAEYYCRRCDTRTSLVDHVKRLLETCESIYSQDDAQNLLNLGVCILRGSEKKDSKEVLVRVELALQKLKGGCALKDIWKVKDDMSTVTSEPMNQDSDSYPGTGCQHAAGILSCDNQKVYQELEDEIEQVLQELRKSQEHEYRIAEMRLHAQKDYLINLYQKLAKEKSEVARRISLADKDELLRAVMDREELIRQEVARLKDMKMVAKGFGKTPKDVLKEHFDVDL